MTINATYPQRALRTAPISMALALALSAGAAFAAPNLPAALRAIGGKAATARASDSPVTAADRKWDARSWLEKRSALGDEAKRLKAAYDECAAGATAPAENVTVPIENYPDGTVKASVTAQKAQFFLSTGYVWGEGVVVSHFSKEGEVQTSVKASNCIIDRNSKSGWADGLAEITYGGTSVEGAGVYFSLEEEYVMITQGTKITSTDFKLGGLKL